MSKKEKSAIYNVLAFTFEGEKTAGETVIDKMDGFNANVITLTVGDELSGEIAQVVSGEATMTMSDDDSEAAGDD